MAKFEVYNDKAGEYRFRLKAGNGQIILASEGYSSKDGCMNGIESVKENSQDDARKRSCLCYEECPRSWDCWSIRVNT